MLILLSKSYIAFGQAQISEDNENTTIFVEIDLTEKNESEQGCQDQSDQDQSNVDIESLIKEYAYIMSIPKDERTIEQWDRTNEILFLIYFNADLKTAFEELSGQIETYDQLIYSMEKIIKELEEIYRKELETYNELIVIQNNLNELYNSISSIENNYKFSIFSSIGYTFNLGINIGLGFSLPINDKVGIGAGFDVVSNFKDNTYFSLYLFFQIFF